MKWVRKIQNYSYTIGCAKFAQSIVQQTERTGRTTIGCWISTQPIVGGKFAKAQKFIERQSVVDFSTTDCW